MVALLVDEAVEALGYGRVQGPVEVRVEALEVVGLVGLDEVVRELHPRPVAAPAGSVGRLGVLDPVKEVEGIVEVGLGALAVEGVLALYDGARDAVEGLLYLAVVAAAVGPAQELDEFVEGNGDPTVIR